MSFAHALAPGGKESDDAPFMLVNMITALLIMLLAFFMQRRAIVLYNNNYPDRQLDLSIGNSKKAQRELFAKMDEGEQWIMYRSSYSALK